MSGPTNMSKTDISGKDKKEQTSNLMTVSFRTAAG
jgi:hypothetical protein